MARIFSYLTIIISIFLHNLKSNPIKRVILDHQEISINSSVLDSDIYRSKDVLYVLNDNRSILIYDISLINQLNMSKTPFSVYKFDNMNVYPYFLKVLNEYQNMIVLSYNFTSFRTIISVFDITNEFSPIIIQNNEYESFKNDSSSTIYVSKNYDKLFILEKDNGIMIFDVFPNRTITKIWEKSLPNCLKFLFSDDENYIFFYTNITVNAINITNFKNISTYEISKHILQIPTIVANPSGTKYYKISQIALSSNKEMLHVLSCPFIWDGTFYTYNISDMSNITLMTTSVPGEMHCETDNEEVFLIISYNTIEYALITDYYGIALLTYPDISFHTRINFWCDKLLILSETYFLGEMSSQGIMKVFKFIDLNLIDDVPTFFVNQINDLPQFPSTWMIYLRINFVIPLYDNYILVMHGGYGSVWSIEDRINPYLVFDLFYNDLWIWFTIYYSVDAYAFCDPNSDYYLVYTRIFTSDDSTPYSIAIYSKNNNTNDNTSFLAPKAIVPLQNYTIAAFRSIKITQIDEIIYILPFGIGESPLSNILTIDLSADNPVLNITNIIFYGMSNVVGFSSCQINTSNSTVSKYVFYKIANDDYMYIFLIDPSNFTNLLIVSKLLMVEGVVELTVSDDCNYLYLGGVTGLIVIDINNKSYPEVIQHLKIDNIYEIQTKRKFLYVMTESSTKKIDISNPSNPKIILNADFPYDINPHVKNYKTSIIEDDDKANSYFYRSFWDFIQADKVNDYKSPISYLMETRSPLYVFILNHDDPTFIGISVTYKYYVCAISKQFYGVNGAITSLQMGNEVNQLDVSLLPSWITVNFDLNEIYITADKSYLNKKIVLIFSFKGTVILDIWGDNAVTDPISSTLKDFQQAVIFPSTQTTLDVFIENMTNHIHINTPSKQNIQLTFNFIDNQNHNFILDYFSGNSNGLIDPINGMLRELRYSGGNQTNFSITVNDQINEISVKNFSLKVLKKNKAPVVNMPIQAQINNFTQSLNVTPSIPFKFFMLSDTFIDPDYDTLTYNFFDLPLWLSFDNKKLSLYGTPSLSDEGYYNLTVQANDGYEVINDTFSFKVYDSPPLITLNYSNITAYIGKDNSFPFPIVIDNDGPLNLIYTYSVMTSMSVQIDINNYWLKFSTVKNEFYGNPDIQTFEIVTLFVSDSLQTSKAIFEVIIVKSLMMDKDYSIFNQLLI